MAMPTTTRPLVPMIAKSWADMAARKDLAEPLVFSEERRAEVS
jgi:hypothetical protein